MARAKAQVETPAVEEIEELDEVEAIAEDEAAKPVKKARAKKAKVEKPVRQGKSTKEAAEELGITPVRLRRILRTDDFVNDGGYTRYDLDDETIERVRALLAAGTEQKKARSTKKAKAGKVESAAEEVEGDIAELEEIDLESDEDEDEDLEFDEEDDEE